MTNVEKYRCGGLVIGHWSLVIRYCSLVLFAALSCTTAFAIDFSGPLQNVQVTLSGSTVTYQVFDPGRGVFVTESANTPAGYISTPTAIGGVVSWLAGNTVYYRIYDPRQGWIGSSTTVSGTLLDPTSDSGIVSWLAVTGKAIYFAVYDPINGMWKQNAISNAGFTSISNPRNSGGIIAWVADQTVWYVSYDPMTHMWVYGNSGAAGYVSDLEVSTGVAAWLANNTAYYVVYDVSRSAWRGGTGSGGFSTTLAIANSTVSWVAGTPGASYMAGYSYSSGAWTTGISTPTHAGFLVTTTGGDAPLFVWFIDLSLGGSSWSWNFGDGNNATGRTPYHVFSGFGRFVVTQTIGGSGSSSSAFTNILTDTAAPAGTMLINNGALYTPTNRVTLTLAVTDNSGTIAQMRFSNTNNVSWSPWVPYATNFAWTLGDGPDGNRSVYGQFMDPSSNISFTISASIYLDSRPPPLVYVTNYFINESTPSLQVLVLLSYASHFTTSVDFATSDGTATGGLDYSSTNGHLQFNPSVTSRSFNLFITNDTLVELNETFYVNLSNPTNAVVSAPGVVTILDDDSPTVSFSTNIFTIDEYTSQALITAILSAPSGRTLSVNYASSNGTAIAGSDYSAVSGTLTFASGQVSRSFSVPILDDLIDEPNETVRLYLSNPTNAVLGANSSATLVIVDDEPPPASFTTDNFLVSDGAGAATISVRLNTPFAQTVFIGYATSNGTAQAGSDYVAAVGTLTFPSGETNEDFVIPLLAGPPKQTNETILLRLTSLNNATPGQFMNATLTIVPPRLVNSSWQAASGFRSTLSAAPGYYAIQMCTNLTTSNMWSEILRLTNTTGTVNFTNPPAPGAIGRFYRARQTN